MDIDSKEGRLRGTIDVPTARFVSTPMLFRTPPDRTNRPSDDDDARVVQNPHVPGKSTDIRLQVRRKTPKARSWAKRDRRQSKTA